MILANLDNENKIRKVSRHYFNDYLNFGFTYADEKYCQIQIDTMAYDKGLKIFIGINIEIFI